jgi:hypothetical protein
MKRTFLFFVVIAIADVCLHAELNDSPRRKVEVAIDGGFAVSNNYFTVSEFMVKDLVVDLKKIADDMSSYGWNVDAFAASKIAINLNFSEKNRFSFFMDVEGSGSGNVDRELFELIGYGNDLDKTYDIGCKVFADVFWETGFSWRRKFSNDLAVTFTPAVYAPLVFMKMSDASVTVTTDSSGKTTAKAEATVKAYSAFPHDILDTGGNYLSYISNAAGLDMSLAAEYPLQERIDVGAYIHFPLIPGRTRYLSTTSAYANYTVDNVLNSIRDNEDLLSEDSGTEDWEYSNTTKNINRPFRLGVQAAYRPFGSWFTLSPQLGFAVRYPFMNEAVSFMEYNLTASVLLADILGAHISTALVNEVFIQELGFLINTRVFELDTAVSFQGGSFVRCFEMSGLGAKIGMKFGF